MTRRVVLAPALALLCGLQSKRPKLIRRPLPAQAQPRPRFRSDHRARHLDAAGALRAQQAQGNRVQYDLLAQLLREHRRAGQCSRELRTTYTSPFTEKTGRRTRGRCAASDCGPDRRIRSKCSEACARITTRARRSHATPFTTIIKREMIYGTGHVSFDSKNGSRATGEPHFNRTSL